MASLVVGSGRARTPTACLVSAGSRNHAQTVPGNVLRGANLAFGGGMEWAGRRCLARGCDTVAIAGTARVRRTNCAAGGHPVRSGAPPGRSSSDAGEQVRDAHLESRQDVSNINGLTLTERTDLETSAKDEDIPPDWIGHHCYTDAMPQELTALVKLISHSLPRRENLDYQVWWRDETCRDVTLLILGDSIPDIHGDIRHIRVMAKNHADLGKGPGHLQRLCEQVNLVAKPDL